jgi:hypothetical protein
VAGFLLFCKTFPLVLLVLRQVLPTLTNDLGDFWVGKPWILRYYAGLVMLTI